MKRCYICNIEKEDHLFYRDLRADDLLTSACSECQKKKSKDFYQKSKKTLSEEQKLARKLAYQKWKESKPDRYKELIQKHNDKKRN